MVLSKDLKLAICFGLIMGALLSICNMCFASENVEVSFLSNASVNIANQAIVTSTGSVGYFEIEPGYVYHFKNTLSSNVKVACFSNVVPYVGLGVEPFEISAQSTFDITYSNYNYLYFDFSNGASGFEVTREPLQGMTNFVDNIAYSLSIGDLSQVWVLVVPIIAISVLLGLGFYLLKRLLNRIKRAKGGV